MNRYFLKLASTALIIGLSLGLTACKKDNGALDGLYTASTTGVTSLSLNDKLSVVEANESSSSANIRALEVYTEPGVLAAAIDANSFTADSDYAQDETQTFVYEQSAEAMDTVNSILCSINQTKFGEFLNQGPFKAQVDDSECDSNGGGSTETSTSGGDSPSYSYWTVDVTRLSNDAPQVVRFWLDDTNSDEPQWIEAKMVISEGKSDTNPLGIFRMDFVGYKVDADGNPTDQQQMFGFMETAYSGTDIRLNFYNYMTFTEDFGGGPVTLEPEFNVSILRSPDGTSGSGTSWAPDFNSFTGSGAIPMTKYNIAYNSNYFYKTETESGKTTCLDRNNFHETAWRYGLYDSNGARVSRNSGFPIKKTTNGTEYNGYIGYWGLWMPESASVSNGDTVTKMDWDASGNPEYTDYTVYQVNGKLHKHTKQTMTLADIKNIPLNMNVFSGTDAGSEYRVMWNGTKLVKTAKRNTTNWSWETMTETEWTYTADDFTLWFWSEALGGNGQIKLKDFTAANQTVVPSAASTSPVVFHTRDVVYPGDTIPSSLRCFNECPDPSKLSGDVSSPMFTSTNWGSTGTNPGVDYSFNTSSHTLQYGGTDVVMTGSGSGQYQHGLQTGAMFEWTTANKAKLACPWDSTQLCPYMAYEQLDVFYTWETGPNDWNKFTTLSDSSGNYLTFEAPLPVKYTRSAASPTKYKDATFYLDYAGFGNLQGIPEKCINVESGQETSCWVTSEAEARKLRYIPEFVIPNGANVIGADATGDTYVVKALEKEQTMVSVNASVCTGAGLSLSTQTLPSPSDWVDPNLREVPVVEGPPAVIGGVLVKTTN